MPCLPCRWTYGKEGKGKWAGSGRGKGWAVHLGRSQEGWRVAHEGAGGVRSVWWGGGLERPLRSASLGVADLFPGSRGPVLGCVPPGVVLSAQARVHLTLFVHCPGAVSGPCGWGLRTWHPACGSWAGEYSGCGVVWCGVVWCGVVWCGVVWCGVVWCGVVCRRRCYPKAKAGMSIQGQR